MATADIMHNRGQECWRMCVRALVCVCVCVEGVDYE